MPALAAPVVVYGYEVNAWQPQRRLVTGSVRRTALLCAARVRAYRSLRVARVTGSGGGRTSRFSATCKGQPVAARTASTVPPGYRAANCNSSVSGWGRNTPKTDELQDRKSTRLNSSHVAISYAVFCLKKKNKTIEKNTKQSKERHYTN